jgi:hypothetical protein
LFQRSLLPVLLLGLVLPLPAAPQADAASVIRLVDAAVQARVQNVLAFTDIEHYAVYRGKDETHPVAEMTARDAYRKDSGKSYTILSQSGSEIVQKIGLEPLLQNEIRINQPAIVAHSWFTSANYEMKPKPGGVQLLHGRACYTITVTPRQKAPNLIDGTIWVDASDGTLVKVDGVASKSPSVFAKTTHMMREYRNIDGYSMATHARAESSSFLFGRTVVIIDYSDYHLVLRAPNRVSAGLANHRRKTLPSASPPAQSRPPE